MSTAAAAVVAIQMQKGRERVLAALQAADSPAGAVSYDPVERWEQRALQDLRKGGAVREAGDGRLWLDQARMIELQAQRRRVKLMALAAVGGATLLALAAAALLG